MASKQPAAKRGQKAKPAPRIVAAPVPIVRRAAVVPKDPAAKKPPSPPKAKPQPKAATAAANQPPAPDDGLAHTKEQRRAIDGYGRDDPARLAGEALRDLGHERGLARSDLAAMSDEKVREQIRYRLSSLYEEA